MKIQNLIFAFLIVAVLGSTIFYITNKNADNGLENTNDEFECVDEESSYGVYKVTNNCNFNVNFRYRNEDLRSEGFHEVCLSQGQSFSVYYNDKGVSYQYLKC
ncbi:hypothetical protein ABPG74_019817 [Tetrahymena malaccensis]